MFSIQTVRPMIMKNVWAYSVWSTHGVNMNQSIVSDLCVMQKRVYVDCRSLSDLVSVAGITDRLVLFPRGIRQTFEK